MFFQFVLNPLHVIAVSVVFDMDRFTRFLCNLTQCRFQNLSRVLGEAGGSLEDVVDLVTYHLSMDDLQTFAAVKAEFFTKDFPSWTVVGVAALALPELLVEIKATAVIGSGSSS